MSQLVKQNYKPIIKIWRRTHIAEECAEKSEEDTRDTITTSLISPWRERARQIICSVVSDDFKTVRTQDAGEFNQIKFQDQEKT